MGGLEKVLLFFSKLLKPRTFNLLDSDNKRKVIVNAV